MKAPKNYQEALERHTKLTESYKICKAEGLTELCEEIVPILDRLHEAMEDLLKSSKS